MDEDKFSFVGGQPIVHDNVDPLSKVPQTEVEDATVATTIFPPLVPGNDLTERGRNGERVKGGEEEGRMDY